MAGLGADLYIGGSGADRVDYGEATGAVRVDLLLPGSNRGLAAGDVLREIEKTIKNTIPRLTDHAWHSEALNEKHIRGFRPPAVKRGGNGGGGGGSGRGGRGRFSRGPARSA
jgi:hypothetical protein